MDKPLGAWVLVDFVCEKRPAHGSRGMVVANHPLGSAAGAEMLLAGGNAIDAAVATLFALTVVEPMMVGILGGGVAHLRLADGRHVVLDGLSTAPAAARADMYRLRQGERRLAEDRANLAGPLSIATPGALAGWCEALERFGTMSLADILQPAIRYAERGFTVTDFLSDNVKDAAADLARDPGLAALYLPGGRLLSRGDRLRQTEYAASLALIAAQGPAALYDGPLGAALADHMAASFGLVSRADLASYRVAERAPIHSTYRGFEIVGPPPPASSGVHIAQMLNILEGFDLAAMGFGTPDSVHLLAEVLKIAFADRAVATADPDFVTVPVERLISKSYAALRRADIDMTRARHWGPGLSAVDGANTTHVTIADAFGNVVATTQTINAAFGARVMIPGTGMIANNYMYNFDPRPGLALSVAPGKRVYTSMAPMMALKDGRMAWALGLPGALRIFPSAMQALVNLIDHGMSVQEAVEAPRIWTEGEALELERGVAGSVAEALAARGHTIQRVARVASGMNAIAFHADGTMTGAACWRADGTPVAISGGLARQGVRFSI